jgi:succinyl-CoA synthetase beta subunit
MALRRFQPVVNRVRAGIVQQPQVAVVQKRYLNIHEYQSSALMEKMGVNVPEGYPASSVAEAVAAANKIGDNEVVIKSQVLAGGRGLGTFTNGLKGGVHVIHTSKVAEYAQQMIGQTLVTKQVKKK